NAPTHTTHGSLAVLRQLEIAFMTILLTPDFPVMEDMWSYLDRYVGFGSRCLGMKLESLSRCRREWVNILSAISSALSNNICVSELLWICIEMDVLLRLVVSNLVGKVTKGILRGG